MRIDRNEILKTLGGKFTYGDLIDKFGGSKKEWRQWLQGNGFLFKQTTLNGEKGRYWCYEQDAKRHQIDHDFGELKHLINKLVDDDQSKNILIDRIGRIQSQVSQIRLLPDYEELAKRRQQLKVKDTHYIVYEYTFPLFYWLIAGSFQSPIHECLAKELKFYLEDCENISDPSEIRTLPIALFHLQYDNELIDHFIKNWDSLGDDFRSFSDEVITQAKKLHLSMNELSGFYLS